MLFFALAFTFSQFHFMKITIRESDISTVVALSRHIPELVDPHQAAEYHRRLNGITSLLLVAYVDGSPAGFKVGYDKYADGSFYSWMGGVLPVFRKNRIAKSLADHQENWARTNGFTSIIFKTRNRHKAMLMFAISNGFSIISVDTRPSMDEHRITLKKNLV